MALTILNPDWTKREFGEFDFIIVELARAPEPLWREAMALLEEKKLEKEGQSHAR